VIEAARLKLARVVLELAQEESRDVEALKARALQEIAIDEPDGA
jgi:hypothetical protein